MPLVDPVTMSTPSTPAKAMGKSLPNTVKDPSPPPKAGSHTRSPVESPSNSYYIAASIPALQLQIFVLLWKRLVDDPVATMSRLILPVMALIQVFYAVVLLPVAGSGKQWRKPRPGEKKKAQGGEPNIALAALLSLLLTLIATPPIHALMVLFGAPFLTHAPHTFLCALNLSLLTLFPLFYTRGAEASAWRALAGFTAPIDESVGGLVGACFGAWLGAVPIPLDWDRDWQRWPVTVLTGIYVGYAIGSYGGRTLLRIRGYSAKRS
ncbi:Glycosylphosphatidylinositol (GPI) anchor assembly protein [Pyricularia oryzae]|uniref:Glycosylphosphatidylinositol (GPI) anchor assembly protein n=2 Tax=Pyricularia TaxID=48558 RepID=A0ABQ8NW71_PYRGI|nr:Glycosylphosphatidylinositol (GPI) anchor assembly protein [Pyricularia oryzae]KAI6302990.1 Glycosylphosphatidylinositol (GPI) anchor assembly protein [Pyricularia grisea]KAH9428490.1 Glycosylphosphatidylinositol (GPI) anchor assembly protein [Pyricularia oryzae]KAI6258926.1 Glycosylphosphatidylinositol (GPI) anchor assembly protein [Pyricularia oryzae]KAI6276050.1 Glycosylphosphatidylinositol (GPI) anchor assembly protein [Pyricularia oryzae]